MNIYLYETKNIEFSLCQHIKFNFTKFNKYDIIMLHLKIKKILENSKINWEKRKKYTFITDKIKNICVNAIIIKDKINNKNLYKMTLKQL